MNPREPDHFPQCNLPRDIVVLQLCHEAETFGIPSTWNIFFYFDGTSRILCWYKSPIVSSETTISHCAVSVLSAELNEIVLSQAVSSVHLSKLIGSLLASSLSKRAIHGHPSQQRTTAIPSRMITAVSTRRRVRSMFMLRRVAWGRASCRIEYRRRSRAPAKSNDVCVRALTKLSGGNSERWLRSCGRSILPPRSRRLPARTSAPARAGSLANSSRPASCSRPCSWKSQSLSSGDRRVPGWAARSSALRKTACGAGLGSHP